MSVEFSVLLVDWEAFQKAVERGVDHEELTGDFPSEPNMDGSWPIAGQLLECFERTKEAWTSPGRNAFAEVFGTLFWSFPGGGERINDLGLPIDNDYSIECAWSPERVKHFADQWRKISLEECRAIFNPPEDDFAAFKTFDEFKAYAEAWGEVIERGAEEGLGLIVLLWV